VSSRARYVREEYGEKTLQRVVEALSPAAAKYVLQPPLAFEWCAYRPLVELDYSIVVRAMGGSVEHMNHFGAKIASYDLPLAYRAIFKLGSPGFVVGRLPTAYRAYFRPGRFEVVRSGRQAEVVLVDAVFPRYMCEFGMSGWLRAAVTLSGGEGAAARHSKCLHRGDAHCRWDISWR